jgi:hypothetical protein
MGLNFGGTSTNSNASAQTTPTFSTAQGGLQGALTTFLSNLMPSVTSGTTSPNVQATQTATDNQTNQNYSAIGTRMNRFLAARGFGQSGQAGQTQLQTELARQGQLGTNASSAASTQLGLDSSYLSDALAAAFAAPGSASSGSTAGASMGGAAAV